MAITVATNTILGNEKAIGLVETIQQSPGNKGFHRYQLIYVNRDGKQAEYRRDMGSEKQWKGVKLLNIPGLLEHTVDELINLADELRNESKIDIKDFLRLDKMNLR